MRCVFTADHIIPSFPYDNPFCLTCAHCKKIHLTKDKTENKLIVLCRGRPFGFLSGACFGHRLCQGQFIAFYDQGRIAVYPL